MPDGRSGDHHSRPEIDGGEPPTLSVVVDDGQRRPRHRRRRPRRWVSGGPLALICVLLAGIVGGAGGLLWARHRGGAPSLAACGDALRVVVSPDLASLVTDAAAPLSTGDCAAVQVTSEEPAATLRRLGDPRIDAWVPDSTLWLRAAAASSGRFPTAGLSLARSPVVLAAPRSLADALGWSTRDPSWGEVSGRVCDRRIPTFRMPDPLRSTAGLVGLSAAGLAFARATADPGIAQMKLLTLRSRVAEANPDLDALLDRAAGARDGPAAARDIGVFPVTEQRLRSYQRRGSGVPLFAGYPRDGLLEVDHPLVTAAGVSPGRVELAVRLAAQFRRARVTQALTAHGFRVATESGSPGSASPGAPDGGGGGAGATVPGPRAPVPATALPADASQLLRMADQWSRYQPLVFQTLLLVDASGSMNDPVRTADGTTTTKAGLLRQAGVQAAELFGQETSVAMWLFGTPAPTSPPYRVVVPFGPLDEAVGGAPRRDVVAAAAGRYAAFPQAGTPLYETVLRGVDDMRARARPDAVTIVVVLTDGRDQDTRYAMSREEFLARLARGRDASRPVPVFGIGYGAAADLGALTGMAAVTGGQTVSSNDPGDLASAVAKIFLAAHRAHG